MCLIDNEEKRRKALALFELADVWGIGKQTLTKLNYLGIRTPLDFADKKGSWVHSHFTKPGLQTWKELNGIPCIDTSEVLQRQTICTSRSFGLLVTDYNELKASVASFAASCANKFQEQHSLTSAVTVFVSSTRFREELPLYSNGQTRILPMPTSDTIEITLAALAVLKEIYREGIGYKKTGVILGNITDVSYIQQNLFDEVKNRPERMQLMKRIDELNHRFGLRKIHLAVEGEENQAWHAKSEFRSGNYLSDLREILTIQI